MFNVASGTPTTSLDASIGGLRALVESSQPIPETIAHASREAERLLRPAAADLAATDPWIDQSAFGTGCMVGDCLGEVVPEGALMLYHRADIAPGDVAVFVADYLPMPTAKFFVGWAEDEVLFLQTNPLMMLIVPAESIRWMNRVAYIKQPWRVAAAPGRNPVAKRLGQAHGPGIGAGELPAGLSKDEAISRALSEIRANAMGRRQVSSGDEAQLPQTGVLRSI